MNAVGKGTVAGAVVVCIVLFIGMCLFIDGFSIVEPTYMAIARNKISSRIDSTKVYFEGRHFLGVGNEFIKFPMAWQLVEYTDDDNSGNGTGTVDYVCKIEDTPLDAATKDGLPVQVEVSLYFTIPPQQLINFYTTYGTYYQDPLANACKKVLKDSMTKFNYEEVFKGRLNISSVMKTALTSALARRRCVLQKLLLRGLSFRDNIESTIEKSVCTDQERYAKEYSNRISLINASISTLSKEYEKQINEVLSVANKKATILINEARAYANYVLATSTATAWKNYQNVTGLDSESLLRVQWARTWGASSSADSITVGYDKVGTNFVQKTKST